MDTDDTRSDRPTVVVDATPTSEAEFGTTVLTTVADELDTTPASLPPLRESIDPDVLNAYARATGNAPSALTFEYVGYQVVVTNDGAIWLYALD